MYWILFVFTLPMTLLSWLGVVLALCLGLAHRLSWEQNYVLSAAWRSWFYRRWHYSTTFGRAVIYAPGIYDDDDELNTPTEKHEHGHVRQMEDESLKAGLIGIGVGLGVWSIWPGLIIWFSGILFVLVNYLAALLRYGPKNMYRDAEHERAMYSQVAVMPGAKESWYDQREKDRL